MMGFQVYGGGLQGQRGLPRLLLLCSYTFPCIFLSQMIYLMQDAVSPEVQDVLKLNVKR